MDRVIVTKLKRVHTLARLVLKAAARPIILVFAARRFITPRVLRRLGLQQLLVRLEGLLGLRQLLTTRRLTPVTQRASLRLLRTTRRLTPVTQRVGLRQLLTTRRLTPVTQQAKRPRPALHLVSLLTARQTGIPLLRLRRTTAPVAGQTQQPLPRLRLTTTLAGQHRRLRQLRLLQHIQQPTLQTRRHKQTEIQTQLCMNG